MEVLVSRSSVSITLGYSSSSAGVEASVTGSSTNLSSNSRSVNTS